jgi:hypothetical protein
VGTAGPDVSTALALVGQLQPAITQGDRARLVQIIGQLVAMRAPMGEQWRQLAHLAANHGEIGLARASTDLLAEALGGGPAALYQKAGILFELGMPAEADAVMRTLPADVPDRIASAYSRGVTGVYLGKIDEARPLLESVTSARPQAGTAWLALARMTDLAGDAALTEKIFAAEAAIDRAAPLDRGAYFYALGKAHADNDNPAAAFKAFARGAQEMKAIAAYDGELDRRTATDAVHDYSVARLAALAGKQSEPTARTIFVTGPPRSGSTLVQQILTSHSAVGDAAELNMLWLLAREIGGASHDPLARFVDTHGSATAARLWHHWLDERFAATGRIVDKSIDASRYLGLVAALLPEAPLIWTTRDPLDRAWSCFSTNFSGGALPWSYDLRDIAAHFRLEERLFGQWQQLLGDRLLVVPYEALVTDPEPWIRRILAHCRLPEEPQVFATHKNRGSVMTASVMQVRQPINRGSVGSAEPYREFLEPFRHAYYG